MKAHDVRHLKVCESCGHLGDGRAMLKIGGGMYHDRCVVESMTHEDILALPQEERSKITLSAAGVELMRKLLDAYGVTEVVSPALERQHRLVATLPQTPEQAARLTPCAALGRGTRPVKCGHCGRTAVPGGACPAGVSVPDRQTFRK